MNSIFRMVVNMIKKFVKGEYEFFLEVNCDTDTYDFWLRKKRYGVMMFCIGFPTEQQSLRIACDWTDEELNYYIDRYKEEFENEE